MKIKSFLLLFILNLFTTGCDNESNNNTNEYDLGKGEFEEPFIGPFSSRPELLRKSLNYPPFTFLCSDTLLFNQEIEATFNEESIRSNSSVELHITDLKNQPLKGVDVYCNGILTDRGVIKLKADSLKKNILLTYKIYPYLGDTILRSKVVLLPHELDKINGQNVIKETQDFILCKAEQKLGYPIIIWSLWLIACLLSLLVILGILYLLFLILSAIITCISMLLTSLGVVRVPKIRFISRKKRSIHLVDKQEKTEEAKTKENDKGLRCKPFFKPWKGIKYEKGLKGKKVLVLGASHYCLHSDDCKYFADCTNEFLMDSSPWNKKCKFVDEDNALLSDTTCLEIKGYLHGSNTNPTYRNFSNFMVNDLKVCQSREELWEGIAFYNYVQFFLPHYQTDSKNVTEKDWEAFTKVVKDINPNIIIVWGKPLGNFMKSKYIKSVLDISVDSNYVRMMHIAGKNRIMIFSVHPYSPHFLADRQNLAKQMLKFFS